MRKHDTAAFKAQVVLELLKEEKTVSQISSEYGIHFTMLHKWKKIATDRLASVFEDEEKKSAAVLIKQHEKETEELYSEIGKLFTPLEWLKKSDISIE